MDDEEIVNDNDDLRDVIPLQFVSVEDVDCSQLSSNELLLHAMTNIKNDNHDMEGGYAV